MTDEQVTFIPGFNGFPFCDNPPGPGSFTVLIWYGETEGLRGQIGQLRLHHDSFMQRIDLSVHYDSEL